VKALRSFGRFWLDFLVGDTPELSVSVLVVLLAGVLLSIWLEANAAAVVVLPLLVLGALAGSLRRATRRSRAHR
jgi:hypothetical protein